MPAVSVSDPILDLSRLESLSLNSLVEIFDQISQDDHLNHLLVLDISISKYINRLTSFSNLKKLTKIENVVWLDSGIDVELFKNVKSVVFLSHDSLLCIELIAKIVKTKILPLSMNIRLSLVFASSNSKFDSLVIDNLNLKGDLDVYNWRRMVPIVLADDLVSLNDKQSLKKLYQFKSISSVTKLSQALLDLVILSNYKLRITNIYSKGVLSQNFVQDFQKNFTVHKSTMSLTQRKLLDDIDDCLFLDKHNFYNKQCDLIVLERSLDIVSPLLTQLTYIGLIDEFYSIDMNEIEFSDDGNKQKIKLTDQLIDQELKDLNFSQIGPILNKKAKLLQQEFESRHDAKDIKQIKSFVDKLNDLTEQQNLVKVHTSIAEDILAKVKHGSEDDDDGSNYFNTLIDLQQQIISNNFDNTTNCSKLLDFLFVFKPPLNDFLKLVILTTIVKKGIRQKEYHTLQKEMLENYGFKIFPLLRNLNDLKLFHMREGGNDNFASIFISSTGPEKSTSSINLLKKSFEPTAQLMKDFSQLNYFLNLSPTDPVEGQDLDFALPGYIPMLTRLVEAIYSRQFTPSNALKMESIKPGWLKLDEQLDKNFIDAGLKTTLLVPESKRFLFENLESTPQTKKQKEEEYIIVAMIGGITYAELATLRFVIRKINKEFGYNKKLLVLTNNVIRSNDVIEMCK